MIFRFYYYWYAQCSTNKLVVGTNEISNWIDAIITIKIIEQQWFELVLVSRLFFINVAKSPNAMSRLLFFPLCILFFFRFSLVFTYNCYRSYCFWLFRCHLFMNNNMKGKTTANICAACVSGFLHFRLSLFLLSVSFWKLKLAFEKHLILKCVLKEKLKFRETCLPSYICNCISLTDKKKTRLFKGKIGSLLCNNYMKKYLPKMQTVP